MKYIFNSNWNPSNVYALPKVYKSKKIVEIHENNNICSNTQPTEDLEE